MRKTLMLLLASLTSTGAIAQNETYTLDLTQSTTPLSFDAGTGAWSGTYDDEAGSIDSQCFSFVHASMGDYLTWWGFTASVSTDNSRQTDFMSHQWSNMAQGGIVLDEEGKVKLDEYGAPVVSGDVPYIVSFYDYYFSKRPSDLLFADGMNVEPTSVYVNMASWPYYTIVEGDAFARAFTNGDSFKLIIHGVHPDESESTIELNLAEYSNGTLTISRGWRYVDLTPLGVVNEMYFTMESTDSGIYGMNTPGYFCLDKLTVREAAETAVAPLKASSTKISYDRATGQLSLRGADFATIYDATGERIASLEGETLDAGWLAPGVYVVKAGDASLKFVK